MMNRLLRRQVLAHFASALLLVAAAPTLFAADVPSSGNNGALPQLSTEEIVSRLSHNNAQRAAALRSYEGKRSYSLEYHGFPSNREAGMEVVAHFTAPGEKNFEVVSGSGSKMLQTKVLSKLLEGEREAAPPEMQKQTALSTDNYSFTLLGTRPSAYGGCYRLSVEPRRDNKFLYRGEICVNGQDFAVESIDAEPAKNPSFWIKKTRIEHRYQKIGQFWLPASNKSVTNVRLGGTATLSILYSKYDVK
jgi:hypothetical protein